MRPSFPTGIRDGDAENRVSHNLQSWAKEMSAVFLWR
jgi:hypothetical protein